MHEHHIEDMIQRLKPVLKDPVKARVMLKRYWRTRMALVWEIADVHRAANERELALTNGEALSVLNKLLAQHNPQYGVRWEDLIVQIEDRALGRKMTKSEIQRFVKRGIITVQK